MCVPKKMHVRVCVWKGGGGVEEGGGGGGVSCPAVNHSVHNTVRQHICQYERW